MPTPAPAPTSVRRPQLRNLYLALLAERDGAGRIDELTASSARALLTDSLNEVGRIRDDFPADPRALPHWLDQTRRLVGERYRGYLSERAAGAPRRFFGNRSHALHFLQSVAPTKLVDGAWLYGLLDRWDDQRLTPLIRIYLEELGDGQPDKHHVLLYRKLIAAAGCDQWQRLPHGCFMQGAIQLALAHHAADFLPEIIGFNLGYEQLPLHLPITAYELNELGVDPYYFTLHVTIDNASTGHARKSLDCVLDMLPRAADSGDFYRRVANGYRLNELGMGTGEAIDSFDLESELLQVLVDKAAIGAEMHADYCRIGGRAVSDWLSTPGQLPQFLRAMQDGGWIKRGQAPENSRFWRLLQDERAPMFGVFSPYELQLIEDWIGGDGGCASDDGVAVSSMASSSGSAPARSRLAVNRFRQPARPAPADAVGRGALPAPASVRQIVGHHADDESLEHQAADPDVQVLKRRLADVDSRKEAMATLQGFISPGRSGSPAGLLATRIYANVLAASP